MREEQPEEEVIEVVSEDDEREVPVSGGVDIIGDRPVKRSAQQAPPGCLYSFLLFLIGFGVGWLGCYAYNTMQAGEEEGDALLGRVTQATAAIKEATAADLNQAAAYAADKNYGYAAEALNRVAQYYDIANNLSGKKDPSSSAIPEIAQMLRSDDPATQQEGVARLAELITDEELKARLTPAAMAEEPAPESEEAAAMESEEAAAPPAESEAASPEEPAAPAEAAPAPKEAAKVPSPA